MQSSDSREIRNGADAMLGESIGRSVWRRRNAVAASVVVCVAAGLLYLVRATPTYTVRGQLYVERRVGEAGGDRPQEYLHAQVAVLRSTAVLQPAMERAGIAKLPELASSARPIDRLRERLRAEVDKQDGLLMLALECSDPAAGADLLNTIIQAYEDHQLREGVLPRAANVGVIEAPDGTAASVGPRRGQVIGLSGMIGLALGIGWTILRGMVDQGIEN